LALVENPIKKVLLIVIPHEGVVFIDERGRSDKNNGTTGDGSDRDRRRLRQQIEQDEIHALQSQMAGLR
jgi:hypothetical protein